MTAPADDGPWIRRPTPAPDAAVRLVCFPHAGGAASYYVPLARALTPGIEVLAVQYPGRQERHREPVVDDIHRLADHIYAARSGWLGEPYAFFGHSMGAILAYEVARRIAAAAEPGPVCLFVSGRRSPASRRVDNVHLRDDAGLVAELRKLGGTDRRFLEDPELLAMILPATRGDYKAIETYAYRDGPPLACPVVALTGDADPNTTVEEAAAWRAHSTGPFDLRVFAGDHFFLEPHRAEVARLLAGELAGFTAGAVNGGAR